MAMPSKCDVLYDQTSAPNSLHATPDQTTVDYDLIGYAIIGVGGALTAVSDSIIGTVDGTTVTRGGTLTAGATVALGAWGTGVTGAAGASNGGLATSWPVPETIRVNANALGVGISSRIIIWGRRNHKGPDVHATAD